MKVPARLLTGAGCLFFIIVFISALSDTFVQFQSPFMTIITLVMALAVLWLVMHWSHQYLSQKSFIWLLISLGLILRIGWIIWIQTPPTSDFLYVHTAALSAAEGDFSFADTEYFASWVYQIGFTLYEALIIKLFGSSIFILKLINVLFSVATAVIIYFAGTRIFNEFTGRAASILYTLYIPNIIMCSVLTNQHLSTFLFMLGCLLLLRGWESRVQWIWIGLVFGLANIIRPIGIVFLIGLVLFFLLVQLRNLTKAQAWRAFAKVAGVIAVFYLLQSLVSYSIIAAGVTKFPLSNREPNWKFMVGLNADTNGTWSMEDAKYALQYELGEARDLAEQEVIKQRLEDKIGLAALIARKLVVMWGSGDASTMWSLQELNQPDLSVLLNKIERAMYVIMSAFGVISLFALYRMKRGHDSFLFILVLLIYAGIHLIIEIQPRYRLDLLPAFILLQSFGMYQVYTKMLSPSSLRKSHAD
jgi:4-amino-4-deoxy-L-arabinose transferase-like glycosyltransferase